MKIAYGIKCPPQADIFAVEITGNECGADGLECEGWITKMGSLEADNPVVYYCRDVKPFNCGADHSDSLAGQVRLVDEIRLVNEITTGNGLPAPFGTVSVEVTSNEAASNQFNFILVLMNPLQRRMCQKFSSDNVCIDTSYSSTKGQRSNYELTTVLVIDDYDEGFPVAYMLSLSVNSENLITLFNSLKNFVGPLHPSSFICDEMDLFHGAWADVMGPVEKRSAYSQLIDKIFPPLKERRAANATATTVAGQRHTKLKSLRSCHSELREIKQNYLKPDGGTANIMSCIEAVQSLVLDRQFARITKLHRCVVGAQLASIVQYHAEGLNLVESCLQLSESSWQVIITNLLQVN